MRFKVNRMTRLTGAALALAAGGMVVLGTTPASAASTTYWIYSPHQYSKPPGFGVLIADTQSGADQRCVATYGFRARGTTPNFWVGGGSDPNWAVNWTCDSN
jgi:hypothetical protein